MASESNLDITVAQPWRHSKLWLASKVPKSEIQQIIIDRTFTQRREYISPALDWLPHDFSLLIDLNIDSSDLNFKKFNFGKGTGFEFLALFSSELEIRMSLSGASDRSSTWKILLKNGYARVINFQERTSSIIDPSGRTVEHFAQLANDHPITSVISNYRMLGKLDLFRHFDFYESYFQHGGK
jgi:hypothetical protein